MKMIAEKESNSQAPLFQASNDSIHVQSGSSLRVKAGNSRKLRML